MPRMRADSAINNLSILPLYSLSAPHEITDSMLSAASRQTRISLFDYKIFISHLQCIFISYFSVGTQIWKRARIARANCSNPKNLWNVYKLTKSHYIVEIFQVYGNYDGCIIYPQPRFSKSSRTKDMCGILRKSILPPTWHRWGGRIGHGGKRYPHTPRLRKDRRKAIVQRYRLRVFPLNPPLHKGGLKFHTS